MENSYGISVNNKFDVFLDEDVDPSVILAQLSAPKKDEKKKDAKADKNAKSKAKQSKKPITTPSPEQKPTKPVDQNANRRDDKPQRNRSRQDDGERFNKENRPGPPRGERREPRFNQENRTSGSTFGAPSGQSEFRERGEGRGRGRGRGGGRGRGRGGERGGFENRSRNDRQSGSEKTGVKSVDKREGGGSYNWGNVKDEIEPSEQMHGHDTTVSSEDQEWNEKPAEAENQSSEQADQENAENPPEPDEEEKQMTLDEWKAMQNKTQQKFNVRRANEGVDDKQFKKGYELMKKKVEESDEEESDDEWEGHHKTKTQVPISITFNDNSRRGGRGRGGDRRGGGGRGGRFNKDREGDAPPRGDGNRGGDRGDRGGDRDRDDSGAGGSTFGGPPRRSEGGRGGGRGTFGSRGGGGRGGSRGGRGGGGGNPDVDLRINNNDDFPALGGS